MFSYLKRMLIGKPLRTLEEGGQSLTKFRALALLSSDALSSIAYGTEEILGALMAFSIAATWYSLPIAVIVLVLLFAITISYRQIIKTYPSGGAYVVARENWGVNAGLVAGGSLLVDYMLTVAVSVASGTQAIISAVPSLHHDNVLIEILIVIAIMYLNLRGLRESASFLVIPVYLFIAMITLMIGVGLFNILTGHVVYHARSVVGSVVPGMTLLVFMRALSSGSSSLTGVEAISNAVPNFKKPKHKNAIATLSLMSIILSFFFASITFLAYYHGILPKTNSTVLSQIGEEVFGRGLLYYLLQISTVLILAVAANTGFSAFPMLAFNLAKDKFMPHSYRDRGDRLGYSNGIISLSIGAIFLILIFRGKTTLLIPLYAVGVFVPFTLSQSGMILHWYRERGKGWIFKATANFIGAFLSLVLVICLLFLHFGNIWPYFIIMFLIFKMFYKIYKHYKSIAKQLKVIKNENIKVHNYDGSTIIVLISGITQVTAGAINYARAMGDTVIALHVSSDENPVIEHETAMEFNRDYPDVRFIDIHTSYRSIINPVLKYCDEIAKRDFKRNYTTTVLVPQFVAKKTWHNVLHNQTGLRLRTALNRKNNLIISTYNYHLK